MKTKTEPADAHRAAEERVQSLLDGFPGLVWRAQPDGGRDYFNRTWLEFTGRSFEAERGNGWLSGVHAEDRDRGAAAYRERLAGGEPFTLEYRLRRHDGQYRQVLDRCSPIRDAQGVVAGYIGACEDVSEARQAREAEDIARREAMQREFVANVSHELRTPVAAIRGFAETLRLGALKQPAVAAEFVDTIERHAQRLQRLIEDLLEISVLECGRRPARPQSIEFAPFLWNFLKGLAPLAEKKRVSLRAAIEPGLTLLMDPDHLGQVLQNLCDNAIKFNQRGGSVTIEGRTSGQDATITVRDTGPGVPPDQVPFLFERFHRRAAPPPEGVPSTGLGLSIVKTIVELNRGSIWAEAGDGGVFVFRVPRGAASAAEPPAPQTALFA